MVGEACLPSNTYYPRTPDYTLCSGVHVCWSEHSDSSFVYGFMILNYGFGTMTATTITSRRARLIWSVTRHRHCAICLATKTSSTKCVPSAATSIPSVTGSIATQLYKQQADLFLTEAWCVFSRLAAAAPTPAVLLSVSRRSPAGSLQSCRDPCSGRVRPSASARASPPELSCISG